MCIYKYVYVCICVSVAILAQILIVAQVGIMNIGEWTSWSCKKCHTPNWHWRAQCYRCRQYPDGHDLAPGPSQSSHEQVGGWRDRIGTAENQAGRFASASDPRDRDSALDQDANEGEGPTILPWILPPWPHSLFRSTCSASTSRSEEAPFQWQGLVSKICSRTGWYVDCLALHLRTGEVHVHGGGCGVSQNEMQLNSDEYICAVTQQNFHVGYLGSALIFHLSSGRMISIEGSTGNKKKKNVIRLAAPSDEQIMDLEFEGSRLARVLTAPASQKKVE